MEPRPPHELPTDPMTWPPGRQQLRETVKPRNRKTDRGGSLYAVAATVVAALGYAATNAEAVAAILVGLGLDPETAQLVLSIIALLTGGYAAITRDKEES